MLSCTTSKQHQFCWSVSFSCPFELTGYQSLRKELIGGKASGRTHEDSTVYSIYGRNSNHLFSYTSSNFLPWVNDHLRNWAFVCVCPLELNKEHVIKILFEWTPLRPSQLLGHSRILDQCVSSLFSIMLTFATKVTWVPGMVIDSVAPLVDEQMPKADGP